VANDLHLKALSCIPIIGEPIKKIQDFAQKRSDQSQNKLYGKFSTAYEGVKKHIQETPTRDLIRQGTGLVAEMVIKRSARGKATRFIMKYASPEVIKVLKTIRVLGKDVFLKPSDAAKVSIVDGAAKYIKKRADELVKKNRKRVAKEARRLKNLKKNTEIAIKQSRNTLPVKGTFKRWLKKVYKGFSEKQARDILNKVGDKVKIDPKGALGKFLSEKNLNISNIKFSTNYFQHIFGVEFKITEYTCGAIRAIKKGGHWMPNKWLKLKNIVKTDKFVKGCINNIKDGKYSQTPKTIFKWGPLQIVKKIKESFKKIKKVEKSGTSRIAIHTITDDGVEIRNIIDQGGNLITSYPI